MSNFFLCNANLNKLKNKEKIQSYYYEPYSSYKLIKRHVHFEDILKDFKDDINSYGFSPFLHCIKNEY